MTTGWMIFWTVVQTFVYLAITGAFVKIGIPQIAAFLMFPAGYSDQKAMENMHFLWNKPWFRFGILFGLCNWIAGQDEKTYYAVWLFSFIGIGIAWFVFGSLQNKGGIIRMIRSGQAESKAAKAAQAEAAKPIPSNVLALSMHSYIDGKGVQVQQPIPFTLKLSNLNRGVFVSGGAGSGKSRSIINPIIHRAGEVGLTGVIYDFKFPTLLNEALMSYTGGNVKIYPVNFKDLSRTFRINPIAPAYMENASFADEAARTIVQNMDMKAAQKRDFWLQSGETLLKSVIWFLRKQHPEYCTLPHAVSLILDSEPEQLVKVLQTDREVKGLISGIARGLQSENQTAGVFSTISNYLNRLNTPEIFYVMSGDEVPMNLNDPATPGLLVVGSDPNLAETYGPLCGLIISTAIKRMNTQGRLPSTIIIDEAPTILLPKFEQIPATARSNKVATVYAVQDVAQMVASLGEHETEQIISNLGTQFWGRTTSPKAAERITKMFGKFDKTYITDSSGRSMQQQSLNASVSNSQSTSIQQRDKIEAQEMMRLNVGEFAGIVAEGNADSFFGYFEAVPESGYFLNPMRDVSFDELNANFDRIKEEAESILKGGLMAKALE
jgi:hypothetical protein